MKNIALIGLGCLALGLSACSGIESEAKYPTGAERSTSTNNIYDEPESIFGDEGLLGGLTGSGRNRDDGTGSSGIAVNSFLWRASLDTVSFLPIVTADPFGGTILSDWYTPVENENERFKVNVFILSKNLRSDGVRVRVFKQRLSNGAWRDVEVSPDTPRQIEDAILTRARQIRISQIGIKEK